MSTAESQREVAAPQGIYERLFHLSHGPMALVAVDEPRLGIVAANDALIERLGVSRSRIEAVRLDRAFRATAGDQIRRAAAMAIVRQETVRVRIAHAQGYDVVRLELELQPVVVEERRYLLLSISTTAPTATLEEMGESGVLSELGGLSRGLVYIHDVKSKVVRHARHPLADRLGLAGGDMHLDEVRTLVHPNDLGRFNAYAQAQVDALDHEVSIETFRMRAAAGGWLWVGMRTRVFNRDADGGVQRVLGVATDQTEEHDHAIALSDAATALARAELNERRRIGRELHDSTAQLLVAARLSMGMLERRDLDDGARGLLADVRSSIAGAQNEISNFAYMLHPPALQDLGLVRCLRGFAAGFSRRSGLNVAVKMGRGLSNLPFAIEVALYRVAQEALMNVYRHAKAQRAWLRLARAGGDVILEVEDDGVGLAAPISEKQAGVGITGMQARMTQLGGALDLLPGAKGLLVRAIAPLPDPSLA